MQIFKYLIQLLNTQTIRVPKGAQFLSLQLQRGIPCIWFLIDESENEYEIWDIHTYGTGYNIDKPYYRFLGTYLINNDSEVYHVFAEVV